MTLIDAISAATSAKKTLVSAIAKVEAENEAVAAEALIDAANEEITSLG